MKYKNVLWDFDGVIIDSMAIRDEGFVEIFKEYSEEQVSALLTYHKKNGGLSRYNKIRYFFEKIVREDVDDELVAHYAQIFSDAVKQRLIKRDLLFNDTVSFIKSSFKYLNFHIVSGSDQNELRYICKSLNLTDYFISINGSPTPKNELVLNLLATNEYDKSQTCLVGDSVNDYDAAEINDITFIGVKNLNLKSLIKPEFIYLDKVADLINYVSR